MMLNALPDKKYCSRTCKIADGYERHRPKLIEKQKQIRVAKNLRCAICGTSLPPRRYRFCSHACYQVAQAEQRGALKEPKPILIKHCQVCGKQFDTVRSTQIYCSDSCNGLACRARNREENRKRDRAKYIRNNELEKRRNRRVLIIAVREAYKDLMGIIDWPRRAYIADNGPIVTLGKWSSYVVLPSPRPRRLARTHQHQYVSPRLYKFPVLQCDNWMTYVVLPIVQYDVIKRLQTTPSKRERSRHNRSTRYLGLRRRRRKEYRESPEKARIRRRERQRRESALLIAFRELNLLPKEN